MAELGVERTDFVEIYTQDLERSIKFYGETLSLKLPMLHHRHAPYSDGRTP